jgi:hypothetical protein
MRVLRGQVNPFWDRFKKTRTTRLYKGYRIDGDGSGTNFEIRAQGVKFGSMRDAQRWADAEVREEAKAARYAAQQEAKDRREEARMAAASRSGRSSGKSARVSSRYKGYRLAGGRDGWEVPELDKGSLFDSKADAKKFVDAQVRSNPVATRKIKRVTAKAKRTRTNPATLIPAKLKRMPNGKIKVFVSPGAAAKLRGNPVGAQHYTAYSQREAKAVASQWKKAGHQDVRIRKGPGGEEWYVSSLGTSQYRMPKRPKR